MWPGRAELVFRAESLDRNLEDEDGTAILAFTGGLNWYFARHHLKAMAALTHRREPDVSTGGQAKNHSATVVLQGAF